MAANERNSISAGPPPGKSATVKEHEVQIAEIELHLRQLAVKILKPSIDKFALMSCELERLKDEITSYAAAFKDVIILRSDVDEMKENLDIMRDEMSQRDTDNRSFQQSVQEKFSGTNQDVRDLRHQLDQKGSKMQFIQREVERRGAEIQALQTGQEEFRHDMETHVEEIKDHHRKTESDISERLTALDAGQQYLHDELWGEEKGLKKVDSELKYITKCISILPGLEASLATVNERTDVIERKIDEANNWLAQAQKGMADLQDDFNRQTKDMKVELREATNKFAATHSAMMTDLRQQHQAENSKVRELRGNVERFMKSTVDRVEAIEKDVSSQTKSWEALHKAFQGEHEELNKKRKRDKLCTDLEFKEVKQSMARTAQQFQPVWKTVEHLGGILSLLMEISKVELALNIQDYSDRRQMSWLGSPNDLSRPLNPFEGLKGLIAATSDKVCGASKEDVIDLKKMTKLKRLNYIPGNVLFGDTLYERPDLIQVMQKLLDKAGNALERGPPAGLLADRDRGLTGLPPNIPEAVAVENAGHTVIPKYPGGDRTLITENADIHDSKDSNDGSKLTPYRDSRPGSMNQKGRRSLTHRPGSVGQPGAIGSRGRGDAVGGLDLPIGSRGRGDAVGGLDLPMIPSGKEGPPGVGGLDLPPISNKIESGGVAMMMSAR